MSVDRTKILEAAQKHLAKGAYEKAISEFLRLVQADPSDVRTWLKIGDLHRKRGSAKDAVDTYLRVADQYAKLGDFHKAVAVHKQILTIDATRLDVQLKLAEAYERLQLTSDALGTYEQASAQYARQGNVEQALAVLGRMAALEPDNVAIQIKYAEALSRANRPQEAAAAFETGGRLLQAQGRIDDYLKVAERLLFHRPDDVETAREVAGLYLARQDPKRALTKLQVCFKADPKDIATLMSLAEAFLQLAQLPKAISVLREVTRIHQEAGRSEERARTLKRILELDPGDAEARQALAGYAAQAAPVAAPRREYGPPPGAVVQATSGPSDEAFDGEDIPGASTLDAQGSTASTDDGEIDDAETPDDDVEMWDADEEPPALVPPHAAVPSLVVGGVEPNGASVPVPRTADIAPGARTSSGGTLSPELARDAMVAKLWTECEVFQRYGLKAKVVEQLRRILTLEPSHVGARERLKDALIDRGDFVAAAAELHALADLHADQPAAAMVYLREILLLDPLDAAAKHRLARTAERPAPLASELTSPEVEEFEAEKTVFEASDSADAEPFAPPTLERPLEPEPVPARDEDELSIDVPSARVGAPVEGDAAEEATTDGANSGAPDDGRASPEITADEDAGGDELFFVDDDPDTSPPTIERSVSDDEEEATLEEADLALSTSEFPPETPASPRTQGDLLAPMSPEEFERAPGLAAAGDARDEVPIRAVHAGGDVEDLLDEADFYVAQGLFDDARAMLEEAVRTYPRNRLIADKLADLDEVLAARSRASRKVTAPEDHSFALAERLAADLDETPAPDEDPGGDVLDVDHVFSQFKKGVEAQVSPDDVATHFDLGIAYKEMGLVVDAVAEFERCTDHPEKECIAHAMIGVCHFEQGAYAQAIAHFKKGLYAEVKTEREETGLYFELGCAYQASGDAREALYYFDKVRRRDASFRNVGDRIAALARDVASTPATAASSADDVDAAFDDLMGDDL